MRENEWPFRGLIYQAGYETILYIYIYIILFMKIQVVQEKKVCIQGKLLTLCKFTYTESQECKPQLIGFKLDN